MVESPKTLGGGPFNLDTVTQRKIRAVVGRKMLPLWNQERPINRWPRFLESWTSLKLNESICFSSYRRNVFFSTHISLELSHDLLSYKTNIWIHTSCPSETLRHKNFKRIPLLSWTFWIFNAMQYLLLQNMFHQLTSSNIKRHELSHLDMFTLPTRK